MKCRYCDSFVPDYYNNCPHCGAQLIKDGFSEQHSKPAVNKTPTVDKRKVLADNNCNKEDISGNELKAIGCCLPRKTQKVGNHGISRNKAG